MIDARRLALSHFGALWLHFKHFPSTIFFLAVSKIFFFLHLKIIVKISLDEKILIFKKRDPKPKYTKVRMAWSLLNLFKAYGLKITSA